MKTKFRLLTLAVVLCVAACSEGGVDETLTPDPQEPTTSTPEGISFTAQMNAPATKATDTAFEDSDEISVTAYTSDGSVHQGNVNYSYSTSSFTSTTPIQYSTTVTELEYCALYPYNAINSDRTTSFTVKADQSSGTNYTLSDLMVGYAALTSDDSPKLTFDHLLTKIVVNITSSDVSMLGASATLTAVAGVDYDLSSLSSSTFGTAQTITMASNGINSYKAIIVPQSISSSTPFGAITTTSGDYEFYVSSSVEFEAGSVYTISASIKDGAITFDEPIINDWNEGKFPDVDDVTIPDGATVMTLAQFSASSYPQSDDVWYITDTDGTTNDFAGLRSALLDAANYNREISLEFPNLEEFPESALYISDSTPIASIVSVSAPEATTIGDSAFELCYGLESISLPKATTIGNNAFYGCSSLESISLPEATTIGYSAFQLCGSLESISLPEATEIGGGAFMDCNNLTSLSLPEVTTVETNAFWACEKIKLISMPKVRSISLYVFGYCRSLVELEIATADGVEIDSFGDNAFFEIATSDISLTLGRANSSMVSNDNLYFYAPYEGSSYTYGPFKEIILK